MKVIGTKFGFERQVVDVEISSGKVTAPLSFEVKPETPGNWVRVVWRLPKGYRFSSTNPISKPGDDFEDPGFEPPDTDPEADPSEPFVAARHRRFAWTARSPGNKVEETYEITLSTGDRTPDLKIINRS
jgi:hypothetical protein